MNDELNPIDDDLDPASALELVTRQQDEIERRMAAGLPAILAAWGVAWGVGFTMLWLIDGLAPAFRMPVPIAVVTFIVLMAGALAISGIVGARMGRGIRTGAAAAWTGTVYGLTWPVGFIAILALGNALAVNGMPSELGSIFYPTASTMFAGIMYILAGAIWQSWPAIAMGGWIVLVACVAPFFGYPTHYLVFAIAGGGVFILGAIAAGAWVSGRRSANTFGGDTGGRS